VKPLPRRFYEADSRVLAPLLLNKVLVVGDRRVRIVEVEAYAGAEDPASHAFRGPTRRNATMFGAPGHLYVYFTYGMHWCANVVCGTPDDGHAVLLRAGAPLAGLELMRAARPAARRDRDLCSGPARLCQALGLTSLDDGVDLVRPTVGGAWVGDDGTAAPVEPGRSGRIGLSKATEWSWRWFVTGDPNVSR
jgi:DNA-3-methyladenine glycosylase